MLSVAYCTHFWRGFLLTVEVICMIPVGFMASMASSTTMLPMIDVQARLGHLLTLVKNHRRQQEIGIFYREIQIFTGLSNEAFGTYMWATPQFIDGGILIQFLYVLIILHKHFSTFVLVAIVIFAVTCSMYISISKFSRWKQASQVY